MKGFTLLYASLIVSLILSVAMSIAHIALTEVLLSSAGKDSQSAFYAADTGLECALYYENNVEATGGARFFPYKDGNDLVGSSANDISSNLECGTVSPTSVLVNLGANDTATTTSKFSIQTSSGICFGVVVEKKKRDAFSTDLYIESRGYSSCDVGSPRRVERGLYTTFSH